MLFQQRVVRVPIVLKLRLPSTVAAARLRCATRVLRWRRRAACSVDALRRHTPALLPPWALLLALLACRFTSTGCGAGARVAFRASRIRRAAQLLSKLCRTLAIRHIIAASCVVA